MVARYGHGVAWHSMDSLCFSPLRVGCGSEGGTRVVPAAVTSTHQVQCNTHISTTMRSTSATADSACAVMW